MENKQSKDFGKSEYWFPKNLEQMFCAECMET